MSMNRGILRTWIDARGFGFNAPTHGGLELLVQINALPQEGSRPKLGETLQFELGPGKEGKPQANRIRRLALMGGSSADRSSNNSRTAPSVVASPVAVWVHATVRPLLAMELSARPAPGPVVEAFCCDGPRHCSKCAQAPSELFLVQMPRGEDGRGPRWGGE